MKRTIVSLALLCSVMFATDTVSSEGKDCIGNLEKEVVQIVNSDITYGDKQKAIDSLKIKIETKADDSCESDFEKEVKRMVFGDKKVVPSEAIEEYAKKTKKTAEVADINSQDCIENFEAEVLKIINSNPDNKNINETHKIMHAILHDKVVESCESEFEKETKKIVNSK